MSISLDKKQTRGSLLLKGNSWPLPLYSVLPSSNIDLQIFVFVDSAANLLKVLSGILQSTVHASHLLAGMPTYYWSKLVTKLAFSPQQNIIIFQELLQYFEFMGRILSCALFSFIFHWNIFFLLQLLISSFFLLSSSCNMISFDTDRKEVTFLSPAALFHNFAAGPLWTGGT